MAFSLTREQKDIQGAARTFAEGEFRAVAHYWRNAKVLEIFEGTEEIEKIIIGRKILGR